MARRIDRTKVKKFERQDLMPFDGNFELDFAIEDVNLHEDEIYTGLSAKQRRFVYFLYVQEAKGWTNSKTYKAAYLKPEDFPNNQASVRYHELIKKDKIKHCRLKVMKHIQKKLDKIPRRVIQEETAIAFADIAKYFDTEGHLLLHPSKLPPKARAAIASLKSTHLKNGNTVYEVSLWNKGASLARLETIFGMNSAQKVEVGGPGGGPIKTMNMNYDISLLSYEDKRSLMLLLEKCKVDN